MSCRLAWASCALLVLTSCRVVLNPQGEDPAISNGPGRAADEGFADSDSSDSPPLLDDSPGDEPDTPVPGQPPLVMDDPVFQPAPDEDAASGNGDSGLRLDAGLRSDAGAEPTADAGSPRDGGEALSEAGPAQRPDAE